MRTIISLIVVLITATTTVSAAVSATETKRIQEAAAVLTEIHAVPDKDIPQDLWNKAHCVIVVPSLKKAAFVFGGEYGKGLMSCRRNNGWSAPVFMEIEKGSWGAQIGAESIDLVLLVMNSGGMEKLLSNKVTLGAGISAAVGPIGRDAQAATNGNLNSEILSYSRAKGLFAGVDLSGGVLKPDADGNLNLYGKDISPRQVLIDGVGTVPPAAQPFMQALRRDERTN